MIKSKTIHITIYIAVVIAIMLVTSAVSMYAYDYFAYKNKLVVTSATVFGKDIKLEKGKYVYDIFMKSGEIKDESGGCEIPFVFTTNQKNNSRGSTSSSYLSPDLKEASETIDINSETSDGYHVQSASYEFNVFFEEPIKVSERCHPRQN